MAECIFRQIIKGELPCAKIYEDERVISFLDINPINGGHTLVLPKNHYATLFECFDRGPSRLRSRFSKNRIEAEP
jgi:histidine triad (HIT) family protein